MNVIIHNDFDDLIKHLISYSKECDGDVISSDDLTAIPPRIGWKVISHNPEKNDRLYKISLKNVQYWYRNKGSDQ
jgi:hypothetical protein